MHSSIRSCNVPNMRPHKRMHYFMGEERGHKAPKGPPTASLHTIRIYSNLKRIPARIASVRPIVGEV